MNPLSNIRSIKQLNEKEVRLGINENASWHNEYKDSAWIFVGGLAYELTEGDIICVFSQYGEVVNINLIRDKLTGKSKGYSFMCYEDQRSTVLAVDNLNGIKLSNRTIRVDHVANYKVPKDFPDTDPLVKSLRDEGCAPVSVKKMDDDDIKIVENNIKTDSKKRRHIRKRESSSEEEQNEPNRSRDETKRNKYDTKDNKYESRDDYREKKHEREKDWKTSKPREHHSKSFSHSNSHKHQEYSSSDRDRSRKLRSRSKSPKYERSNHKERYRQRSESPKSIQQNRNYNSESSRYKKKR